MSLSPADNKSQLLEQIFTEHKGEACKKRILDRTWDEIKQVFKNQEILLSLSKSSSDKAAGAKPETLEPFTDRELICLGMHFKMYHYQCVKGEVADWGKPCESCSEFDGCQKNWGQIAAKLQAQFGIRLTSSLKRKPYAYVLKI